MCDKLNSIQFKSMTIIIKLTFNGCGLFLDDGSVLMSSVFWAGFDWKSFLYVGISILSSFGYIDDERGLENIYTQPQE
jgi:hypothetical protein